MTIQKKTGPLPADVAAAARARAAQARKEVEQVGRANLLTPEEKADAAPFYFVLRNYIRQLKAAREAAGLTLTEVASRSGLALESLSRLETGAQTNPTWRTLGLYAVAIGCAPSLTVESAPNAGAGPSAETAAAPIAEAGPRPQGVVSPGAGSDSSSASPLRDLSGSAGPHGE